MVCGGRGALQHLRRHERHLAQSLHQSECLFFADVLRQHARVGAGIPRMSDRAVACDHDQGIGDDRVDCLLRVGEYENRFLRSGIVQFVEASFGEMLAAVGQNEIAVVDAQLLAPAGIEERRIHGGHPSDVGIRLGGYIESACASARHQ